MTSHSGELNSTKLMKFARVYDDEKRDIGKCQSCMEGGGLWGGGFDICIGATPVKCS